MRKIRKKHWIVTTGAIVLFAIGGSSQGIDRAAAQQDEVEYPTKPVEIIIGRSAGGGMDLYARGVAPYLQRHLPGDSSVIVSNRPGGGGAIALTAVRDAEPNGYRITMTITSTDIINAMLHDEVTYELSEFEFLGSLYYSPTGVLVRSDLEWDTIDDMRAAAEDEPIAFGTTGHGSTAHIEGRIVYDQHLGVPIRFVHYPGTSDAMLAMARGEVHATTFGAHTAAQFAEDDENLEMLFVWSKEPVEFIEEVPTALDAGVTEEEFESAPPVLGHWRAMMTTPGTPEPVLKTLRQAFLDAMDDPEFEEWRVEGGFPKDVVPGEEFQRTVEKLEKGYEAISDELIELSR